jgi:hypothetical protein
MLADSTYGLSSDGNVTPAMQLGVTDHIWTVRELVEAALNGVVTDQPQGRKVGAFRVIDGGH